MLQLYTETTVEIKPTTAASRLRFEIPRKNGSFDKSKQQGRFLRGDDSARDENSFANLHLASSSSIYHRRTKTYPRAFLWRVVADHRSLEIQSTDTSRPERDQREAYLTLSFDFQDAILPEGIAFADPPHADELHVFVSTSKNEVFHLSLLTDYFRSSDYIPQSVGEWCKPIDVSSLSIDTVYRVYASSPFEVFVAFTGGKLLRLQRKNDSEVWNQNHYDDASWGSTIRGMVGRRGQQYLEYGADRLALTAAQGMVASSDTTYLYTLCLNHTLRAWHLDTGRLVDMRDLLDVAREANEKLQLNPADAGLIRLARFPPSDHQTLITYTPHEGGQFKFWDVKGGLTSPLIIEDKYPHAKLSPPDPDPTGNTVWSLVNFEVVPSNNGSQLWLLWRNNNYHQVYTVQFDTGTLPEDWERNWIATSVTSKLPEAPDFVVYDAQDVTSKWMEYLFFPGRYSSAVLETALSRYETVTGAKLASTAKNKSVEERLSSVVASSVSLRKYEDSEMDYDRFSADTDQQWRNFWRLLETLNGGRQAPLSLSYDLFTDMAWVVMADACTAVRECSNAELLLCNEPMSFSKSDRIIAARWQHRRTMDDSDMIENMTRILHAARKLRRSFSPELAHGFASVVEEELFVGSDSPTAERIVLIYNQIDLAETLSIGAEQDLQRDLNQIGGTDGVTSELMEAIVSLLSYGHERKPSSLRSTMFGYTLLSAALLDHVLSTRETLLDLLVLAIFIDESNTFDPAGLFDQVIAELREQERNLWLSTHFSLKALDFLGHSTKASGHDPLELTVQSGRPTSVMEDIFMKNVRPQPAADRPMMYIITDMIADIQFWARSRKAVSYEDMMVHIQCCLIVNHDYNHATEFLKFQPSTSWSTYIKGRLQLIKREYAQSAMYFRQAAHNLAQGKVAGKYQEMSSNLLSSVDAEHLSSGLPRYFQHIMSLFEAENACAQAAEFGRLSLQALGSTSKDPTAGFKHDVLNRLFNAELKCARFKSAYDVLTQFADSASQRSSATALMNAILDPALSAMDASGALDLLQTLPWSSHTELAGHLDQHLTTLAKKQTSIPGVVTNWSTSTTIDYLSILYALRLSKSDHRGATSVLFDRLRIIQKSGRARTDPQATSLRHALLALINTMSCVAPDEAYILADIDEDPRTSSTKRSRPQNTQTKSRKRKRVVITLDELRREYQRVLDRCSRIERGDFAFDDLADSEDEDGHEGDTIVNGSKLG